MMNILAHAEEVPRVVGINGLHYCVLMLEQAGLPENWKKDFYFDHLSSALKPEAKAFGRQILSQIEQAERASIDDLRQETLDAYTRQIGIALDELYTGMEGLNVERGKALLKEMRAAPI
jgi:hypothetical protein